MVKYLIFTTEFVTYMLYDLLHYMLYDLLHYM